MESLPAHLACHILRMRPRLRLAAAPLLALGHEQRSHVARVLLEAAQVGLVDTRAIMANLAQHIR